MKHIPILNKKLSPAFATILLMMVMATATAAPTDQNTVSKQEAVNIAKAERNGRVLGVKRRGDTWRVKSLSKDGEVHIIVIDARSGNIISR